MTEHMTGKPLDVVSVSDPSKSWLRLRKTTVVLH